MIYNIENYLITPLEFSTDGFWSILCKDAKRLEWILQSSNQSLPDSGSYYYQIDLDGNGTIEKMVGYSSHVCSN
jgi:hypothetical protein